MKNKHKELIKNWIEQSKNPIIQLSCPRSGLHWSTFLIKQGINARIVQPFQRLELGNTFWWSAQLHDDEKEIINGLDKKRLITLTRDPKDVMRSWYLYKKKDNRFDGTIEQFIVLHCQEWSRYTKKQVDFLYRYEDLCLNPLYILERLFFICDLPFDKDKIKKAILTLDTDIDGEMREIKGNQEFVNGQIRYETHVGKWQNWNKWEPQYNEIIWDICKEGMKKLGYRKNEKPIINSNYCI